MAKTRMIVQTIKQATVVTLEDSSLVDAYEIDQLGQELNHLVEKKDRRIIVLDLSKVVHLSSHALSILLVLRKKIEDVKGALVLCGVSKDLKKLFKVTSLHKIFTFADTEEDGLNKLGIITA
jgi:stage II sporulation protein AA (anti-sigma F factor antagonist)